METLNTIFTQEQAEIIKAVLYFDVFKYPLTCDELFENSAVLISREAFDHNLTVLLKNKVLQKIGNYVLTWERSQADIDKRLAGNKGAKDIMPLAHKYAKKVASYPFVEGVCLSGGISKNYFDEKGDIDFFIIAKPGRLWLCRSFLILRYKLMPTHLRRYWCPNYFISSANLTIPDINTFTGTELAYLIPVVNYSLYKKILAENSWYKLRFPNKHVLPDKNCINPPTSFKKTVVEFLLRGAFGTWADSKLLDLTLRRWRKKFPFLSASDFELQFRSRKDVCKRHSHGFQNKILVMWEEKTRSFERDWNMALERDLK